ncbi:hypothetical protein ACW9UR_20630 [Halovulum sp. GXIMD14794]
MRVLLAAALLAVASPALADYTSGTVAGFDSRTNTLTLTDQTVWMLPKTTAVPEALTSGDRVIINFRSNADNGWDKVYGIERAAN